MAPFELNLADLISDLENDTDDATALDRVTEALRRSHTLGALSDQMVGYFIDKAREHGASWSQIGDAIGVSKQAAQQRWPSGLTDGFTDRARSILVRAQDDARTRRHQQIGTEHLLLGILEEARGVAAHVVASLTGSAERGLAAVIARMPADGVSNPPTRIPYNAQATEALDAACRHARALGHDFVGTEHVLLGLFDAGGPAADALADLKITPAAARAEVIRQLEELGLASTG